MTQVTPTGILSMVFYNDPEVKAYFDAAARSQTPQG